MTENQKNKLMKMFSAWYAENEEKLPETRFNLAQETFSYALEAVGIVEAEEKVLKQKRKDKAFIAEDFLYDSPGMKATKYSLTGVFHDSEGYKVVTDGHYLVAVKADIEEGLKEKIIARDGTEIKAQFPKWRKVIPDYAKYEKSGLTKEDITSICSVVKGRSFAMLESKRVSIMEGNFNFRCNMLNLKLALKFWESFPEAELLRESVSFENDVQKEAEDNVLYSGSPYALKAKDNVFLFMPLFHDCPVNYKYDTKEKIVIKVN